MSIPVTYLDSDKFREEVLSAVDELASLVAVTLGPGGRPVLLEQGEGKTLATKDGVTVARHFAGNTPVKRVVASSAVEVCERTARQAGDGTTTAIVLAAALVREGQAYLSRNPGLSPQRLARQLRELLDGKVREGLLALSRPVKGLPADEGRAAVRKVAAVSANHDLEIADAVAEAVDLVGEDGMVVAEEGTGSKTSVQHSPGFPMSTGLRDLGPGASTAFVNGQAGECRVSGAYCLMYDGAVRDFGDLKGILTKVASELGEDGRPLGTPLVVFAHGFDPETLKLMSQNFRRGAWTIVPVVTPRNGQEHGRQSFLHDLRAYVGGQVLDPQGTGLGDATLAHLGFASSARLSPSESVLEADFSEADTERVSERIAELKRQLAAAGNDFDRDRLRYRIGQLTGGVATVVAGGSTALEAKERHARVVDAVSAVRSAMELGVVPGGGSALLWVSKSLSESGPEGILKRALRVPFAQILRNAGATTLDGNGAESAAVAGDIGPAEGGESWMVFDALEMRYADWWESGIVDPARVTLSALENALSVAQLLMTLGGVVAFSSTEDEQKVRAMQEAMVRAMRQEE